LLRQNMIFSSSRSRWCFPGPGGPLDPDSHLFIA
jgi:hypothetical protein